ncbi:MAG: hypothetical protein IPH16_02230 [Haliscomenobacter sp.]|nr:hypothetical protein [Haliscomenobacter sp.]
MKIRFLFFLIFLSCNLHAQITFKTRHLELSIDPSGHVAQWTDRSSGKHYADSTRKSPLLAVYLGAESESPSKASYNPKSKTLTLQYPRSKATLTVRVEEREEYRLN